MKHFMGFNFGACIILIWEVTQMALSEKTVSQHAADTFISN